MGLLNKTKLWPLYLLFSVEREAAATPGNVCANMWTAYRHSMKSLTYSDRQLFRVFPTFINWDNSQNRVRSKESQMKKPENHVGSHWNSSEVNWKGGRENGGRLWGFVLKAAERPHSELVIPVVSWLSFLRGLPATTVAITIPFNQPINCGTVGLGRVCQDNKWVRNLPQRRGGDRKTNTTNIILSIEVLIYGIRLSRRLTVSLKHKQKENKERPDDTKIEWVLKKKEGSLSANDGAWFGILISQYVTTDSNRLWQVQQTSTYSKMGQIIFLYF